MEITHLLFYFAFVLATVRLLSRRQPGVRLPPGPPRLPIFGNFFNRPVVRAALAYTEMKAQYGDIISLKLFGQPMIILNSFEAANELLEKRSSNYSDRPALHMANDLSKRLWDFANMRYSEEWRVHRKMFHEYFQQKKVVNYRPIELEATRVCLKQMMISPDGFFSHVRHHAGSIILRTTYGYSPQASGDSYVEKVDNAFRGVQYSLIPGWYLVDLFPVLKHVPAWFPFATFKRNAQIWGQHSIGLRDEPFEMVLQSMRDGTATTCFVTENIEEGPLRLDVVRNCAGLAFAAGADTTVAVTLSAILALVNRPEIQANAHAELDRVVGRNRLPDFGDIGRLKYIEAIILEVMRWRPAVPLAISHANVSDDSYDGYTIPAGSYVLGNAWAILHDERTYRDAMSFNPERFLGSDPEPHPTSTFGFGRRICPGRYLAMDSTFMIVASVLWAFDLKAPSEDGRLLKESPTAWTDGFLAHPQPFKCRLVPRFEGVEDIVNSDYSDT